MSNENVKSKSNVAIIIALILFFPLGLFWMWKNSNWKKVIKIIITVFFVFYTVLFVAIGATTDFSDISEEPTKPAISDSTTEPVKASPKYTIADKEDMSYNWNSKSIRRMSLKVTYPKTDIESMSDEQITDLLKQITEDYKSENGFNHTIWIYLFAEGDNINAGGYSIAMSCYAPYGETGKATEITSDDYSTFEYNIHINSKAERDAFYMPPYEYTVEKVEDIGDSIAKRERIHVSVKEDDINSAMDDDEIALMIESIAKHYTHNKKLNALTVFLYIEGDQIGNGATIGLGTYAPYGDISKASEVKAGDYSTFDFNDITVYPKETREELRKSN